MCVTFCCINFSAFFLFASFFSLIESHAVPDNNTHCNSVLTPLSVYFVLLFLNSRCISSFSSTMCRVRHSFFSWLDSLRFFFIRNAQLFSLTMWETFTRLLIFPESTAHDQLPVWTQKIRRKKNTHTHDTFVTMQHANSCCAWQFCSSFFYILLFSSVFFTYRIISSLQHGCTIGCGNHE